MTYSEIRVRSDDLSQFTKEVFVRVGLPLDDAEVEAEVLIWANLRGVDSHGVLRIPSYVEWVSTGIMNPKPNVQILKETPAIISIDADRSFGPVVTKMAMNCVMEKAKNVGIGWGLIRNTTHQGAMGYYSLMAAEQDMVGIAIVCGAPNMAPVGARSAGVANSPISIGVPGKNRDAMILDMATSVAAGGKIKLAVDKGIPIPEGWGLDQSGDPTTDPNLAVTYLPFGGPKGSGLAIMFESMSSLLVNSPALEPVITNNPNVPRGVQNGIVAAIDIGTFTDVEVYKGQVDSLIDALKSLPKAEGFSEVLVPGEPEDRVYKDRIQHGIPIPKGTARNLKDVAERFGVKLPPGL